MTDVTPPTGEKVEITKEEYETLTGLKKSHDDIHGKYRILEKEVTTYRTQVDELSQKASAVDKTNVELLKVRKAYEAGLPSRFLTFVSGTTEEEIGTQIDTLIKELGTTPPPPVIPPVLVTPPLVPPHIPPPPAISKTFDWNTATREQAIQMQKDILAGKVTGVFTPKES